MTCNIPSKITTGFIFISPTPCFVKRFPIAVSFVMPTLLDISLFLSSSSLFLSLPLRRRSPPLSSSLPPRSSSLFLSSSSPPLFFLYPLYLPFPLILLCSLFPSVLVSCFLLLLPIFLPSSSLLFIAFPLFLFLLFLLSSSLLPPHFSSTGNSKSWKANSRRRSHKV